MWKKISKFLVIFLVIFGITFSNTFYFLATTLVNSYISTRGIVDELWLVQQKKDPNIVDKFVSLRSLSEEMRIHEAMAATTFINVAHYNAASLSSPYNATVNKPTNTADDDIMFTLIMRNNNGAVDSVPAGWNLLAEHQYSTTYHQMLYWKVASGEGASYTWSFASSGKTAITIATFRGGFDTADPIDVYSNTEYITSGTTIRAASMNVSAVDSVLLNFATTYTTTVRTFTKPTLPTTDWVEHYDGGATTSDFSRTIDSMTWTGSGATGNIDTICSATQSTTKHAFAVALNPPPSTDAYVSVSGTQTSGMVIPSTDNYVGGKFIITETGGSSRNVTGMTIAEQGTVDAQTNLDNIKLYYESDTSAPYDCASETYAGTESQFGSTDTDGFSAANGTSAFTGSSVGISTVSTMCVYAVLDVGSGATNGQTLEIQITNPSTDVTTSAGTIGPVAAVAVSGTTTFVPPGVTGSLGKTADGWAGAVPVYMTLIGIASSSYPYARAQVTTISSQVFYADMTWDAGDNRYEGTVYPGSNICMGCDDPKTYNGSFSVVVQLDNNSDFSSVDYSGSAVTFTTAVTLKRSSMDNVTATNYTDFNAVWSTDHWNISIDDFGFSMNTGSGSNIAVAVPIHPITSSPSNFAVSYNGSSVSQGSAQSTTNAWWWESDSHTLYLQFASLTTTLVDVDIDFQSDTDLFATRYNWTYTADMGSRKGSNGLYIANHYLTTFYYGKPLSTTDNNVACSGNECEMTGMQAESRAHEDGGPDESTDCMERVAVHVDDTTRSDATTYYQYDIKWKPSETPDWIISENNNQMVLVTNSDDTASTGWAQQLNNGIAAQRTQTFYANKRYIKNVYDFTNNDSVAHKYPMVWEREQWHGTDRATNDAGRFQGDTSDRVVEERIALTGFSCPWLTAYDLGTFINMGVVFSSADLPDYGIFGVEPFLAPTTAEWPIVITEDHVTNTADQTGFEKTWSSVAASETVSYTFWHVHNAESSWANISTAMDADCAEVNNSSFTQSAYRWFSNANSTQVGSILTATQNASTTLANSGDAFRLRMLMHVDSADVSAGSQDFKLQVATSTPGGCDAGFVGESYVDVSAASGYIRFNNNASPADGDLLTASSTDPTHSSDTIVNQTYEEVNNFTVTSTIAVGNDGKWDFSLIDDSAPADTTFCFRMVKSDGTELDSYSVIPEIKTAPSTGSLSVDIVDSGGSSVASPQVDMDTSSLGFSCQSTTGVFGTSSERIRVENNTGGANWTLTVAATATTSVWSAGSLYFDFNDANGSPNGCIDGGDTDSYAGQMSINPSAGILTPEGGCSSTGISKGTSSAFNQGTVDNITLLSASSADTGCYWDFVDIDIAQQIPAEQSSGSYTIDLVVTVTAS